MKNIHIAFVSIALAGSSFDAVVAAVPPSEPSGDYYDYTKTMKPERPWLVDWHQRFVYRIMLGMRGGFGDKTAAPEIMAERPPEHSIVGGDGKMLRKFLTYQQALEVITTVHDLTCGVPQVVLLTGWQYEGHDSKYPAWGAASGHLKRPCDATAEESLRWLMREARKYNCLVALHINMFDAYEDSPLFKEYLEKDILAKDKNGKPIVGNRWWGMDCYHVSYTQEWKLGLAQRRIDDLISMVPEIRDHHCIYIDAFLGARKADQQGPISPYLGYSKEEEARTQRKIFRYWRDRGIDVASEHVVGLRVDRFVGLQPFACHQAELIADLPDSLYTVSPYQPGFCRVEPEKGFHEGFCLKILPYYYRNHPAGGGDWRGMIQGTGVCMPALWCKEPTLIAYSKDGCKDKTWKLPDGWQDVGKIQISGMADTKAARTITVSEGEITLSLGPDQVVKMTRVNHQERLRRVEDSGQPQPSIETLSFGEARQARKEKAILEAHGTR